jgi:hypothetical protein
MQTNLQTHPQISFPLRMSKELHDAFDSVSNNSMVPKSTLARLAITSLLKDIRDKGIQDAIKDIRER